LKATGALKYTNIKLAANKGIVLVALRNSTVARQHVSPVLDADPDVILAAIG
jgi:hypothetical protein